MPKWMAWTKAAASVLAVVACFVCSSCGDPVAPGYAPYQPIVTLNLNMSQMTTAYPWMDEYYGLFCVGLAWHISPDMYPRNINQQWTLGEVEKINAFSAPGQFVFNIMKQGPPSTVFPLMRNATDDGGWTLVRVNIATAAILVALDANDDDRFELDESGAVRQPDELLGMATDMEVVYMNYQDDIQEWQQRRPIPLSNPQALIYGYNLVRTTGQRAEVIPLDTEIMIGPPPSP